MELEKIILGEMTKTQKDTCHMFSPPWFLLQISGCEYIVWTNCRI